MSKVRAHWDAISSWISGGIWERVVVDDIRKESRLWDESWYSQEYPGLFAVVRKEGIGGGGDGCWGGAGFDIRWWDVWG